jgi:alpha-L-fucosidase 2
VDVNMNRRAFLRGSAVAGVTTYGLTTGTASPVWARPAGTAVSPHEQVVGDAALTGHVLPTRWTDAPFLGNGALRAQAFVDGAVMRFALSDRKGGWTAPFGGLDVALPGTPTTAEWRLDLWNAELSGTVTTTGGSVGFSAVVHRTLGVLLVSLDGVERVTASLPVRWRERRVGSRRLIAAGTDRERVERALATDPDELARTHRDWWHDYYRHSFVSVPEKAVQRFYWAQQYAVASTTDPHAPIDRHLPRLLGPANQLALSPVVTAPAVGNWAAGDPGTHVASALPGTGTKGGVATHPVLALALPTVLDTFRRHGSEAILRDYLRPHLSRIVGFHHGTLVEGGDGLLHLPVTHSPEYADVTDSTYDLSLLRWATTTLIDVTRRLGVADPELPRWQDTARRLTPYHHDRDGVMIGSGVQLATSHPHASHLMWLYPLRENVPDAGLGPRSYRHWAGMREAWNGGSYATAAGLAATIEDGDAALVHLRTLLRGEVHADTQLLPNLLYRDGFTPVAAVPFQAAQAVLDTVLGDSVFPAVPGCWRDVSVAGLRAPGPAVIDAGRSDGVTDIVRVRAEADQEVLLRHGIAGPVEVQVDGRPVAGTPTRLAAGQTMTVRRAGYKGDLAARDV